MLDNNYLKNKEIYDFNDLISIMQLLRKPNGCPWDIEQNHKSIRNNLIEETYEVIEGIDNSNDKILSEELGDLLLQIVFHSQIADEENSFNITDVTTGICKKLIYRHPHIFGEIVASDTETVLENWDRLKKQEKNQKNLNETLNGVSKSLPALIRTDKIISKINKSSQNTIQNSEIIEKIQKKLDNFGKNEDINIDNLGKLLYYIVALSNNVGINAEEALFRECEKIINDIK